MCGRESPRCGRWPGRPVIATVPAGTRSKDHAPCRAQSQKYGRKLRKLPSDPHRRRAHRADAVEFGLLARVLGHALAGLIALVEQLDLLEFLERLGQCHAGILELALQL